ncbi:MAG: hypothetical protein FD150_1759 [Rhodobacteraceae bacterium]|nr:MAG: hypothetical protein FD150_1759 [Paracoccaceae bacterium]
MPDKIVHLRGSLASFEVALDSDRKPVRVRSGGRDFICRQTQFGMICEPVGPGGTGGGSGPVLQLRVTKKRLFARAVPESAGDSAFGARSGFQRHVV